VIASTSVAFLVVTGIGGLLIYVEAAVGARADRAGTTMGEDQQIIGPLSYAGIRRGLGVLLALALGHAAFSLVSFAELPETIPVHFDPDGAADGFTDATLGNWLFLWLVGVGMGALAALGGLWAFRAPPRYLTIPRKTAFAALPEIRRARAMSVLSLHVIAIGAVAMLALAGIHLGLALAATGRLETFPTWIVWVAVMAVVVEIFVGMNHFSRAVARQVEEHARGPGSPG
jgi:uncharacterized membrane protein